MGGKPSNAMESDRPEAGGADKDMLREKSGLLDRDKQRFANKQAEERAGASAQGEASASDQAGPSSTFSIDNPPNPDPNGR